jgi:hypothetical protein
MRDRTDRARFRDAGDHLVIKKLIRGPAELEISCGALHTTCDKTAAAGSDNLANRIFEACGHWRLRH